ncbi:hypothetical protein C8R41DRAFT_829628 [Lentinula lateritia]|uniref:Uncharacterized protein n=1 Tax=Lentinula lateritia TaxID=40482 RepID=A0ABQ8VH73_9AGAR|nr:hypothetical protein C8R41DRAFT_829628 [Lentinula lateritia]
MYCIVILQNGCNFYNHAQELPVFCDGRPGSGDARKSRRAAPAEDLADLPGWKHDPAADTKT